ncbi:hypothetical protein Esti_000808 [Eimeria stiedai]
MSRKGSDRSSSSAMFVTPRSSSLDDMETSSAAHTKFQHGTKVQMEAPEDQWQLPEEKWVDQQRWEEEQRAWQQQLQPAEHQEDQQEAQKAPDQEQPTTMYPPVDVTQNTEALNQAVMDQLQQLPVAHDDLDRMVGEGEWQQPLDKKLSWNYSRADSSVNGFASRGMEVAAARSLTQSQMSGIQMQNSGIYVEGLEYWNASTNMPVEPMGQEAPQIMSRKFTKDVETGDYVNAHDPTDRVTAAELEKLQSAMSQAAVDETVVDIMKRRSSVRKMKTVSRMFEKVQKKELSAITVSRQTPQLPPVMMTYLPDRYIKTYDRTNCLGQPTSARQYQCSSAAAKETDAAAAEDATAAKYS